MRLKDLRLSTKFTITIAMILLTFSALFSLMLYIYLRNQVLDDADEKTRMIFTQISAVGEYIKSNLRPRMYEIMPYIEYKDKFIIETMSVTHITREIMKIFNMDFRDYKYQRVSLNPFNPENKADPFHIKMIDYFIKNRDITSWNDVTELAGREVIVRVRPLIAEKGCLTCHGDLKKIPSGLKSRYNGGGTGFKEGDIIGVESIIIPLDVPLAEVKQIAISTFVFGGGTLLFLFLSMTGAFWSLVSKPLNRLTLTFNAIARGSEPLRNDIPVDSRDEIGELTESFNEMARHLIETQEELKKKVETMRTILNSITDPLALINPDCTVEMANKAYKEWMEKGVSTVFRERCEYDDKNPEIECMKALFEEIKITRSPLSEFCDNDGRYYYIHFYPVFDNLGNVIKAVHYVKDVTERIRMEEEMLRTEKLAAIGQIAAGIAHEVNNPLGGIRVCFNNLINTEMDEETKRLHIEVINSSLEKIQSIIKQLLEFSKSSAIEFKPCRINDIIENVMKLTGHMINRKNINVVRSFSDIPEVMLDVNKMEQVFLNIILNAVQAMDDGGTLTVTTSINNGYCEISFSDTGCGIPPEIMPRIFDPFFTTKPVGEGTGLGLSVSKSIIEQHSGSIYVESSQRGTIFTVRLPVIKNG